MSSIPVHTAGIFLQQIVARLQAKLLGKDASCSADYFDYGKGIYDGLASCLEAIQASRVALVGETAGSPQARFDVCVGRAAQALRTASDDPEAEDPDKLPNVIPALVALLGSIEALLESLEREKSPEHYSKRPRLDVASAFGVQLTLQL